METSRKIQLLIRGLPRTVSELAHSLRLLGELRDVGWQKTIRSGSWSMENAPPHLNYQAIAFLETVLSSKSRVLEWGSGTSSRFFSERAGSTVSIEHDPVWAQRLGRLQNHILHVVESIGGSWYRDDAEESYSAKALELGSFDLVLIDGLARVDCARVAQEVVSATGFIVLDDLHDPHLADARAHLSATMEGIEFWGVRPYSGAWGGTGVYSANFSAALAASYRFKLDDGGVAGN